MIKTKIASLILAGTVLGGATGAGIMALIRSNTDLAVNAINGQNTKIVESTNLMTTAAEKIEGLKVQIKNNEITINNLKAENTKIQEKVDSLNKQITEIKSKLETSEKNNTELQDKAKTLQTTVDTLNKTIEKNNAQIKEKDSEIGTLSGSIDVLTKHVSELERVNALKEAKIGELTDNLVASDKALKIEMNENKQAKADLEKEKAAHKNDNESNQNTLDQIDKVVQDQTNAITHAVDSSKQVNENYNTVKTELANALK